MAELAELLIPLLDHPDWSSLGNCSGLPEGYMFPDCDEEEQKVAQEVCWAEDNPFRGPCPVMDQCLAVAKRLRAVGVWGGQTMAQREGKEQLTPVS